jgi:DNA invertase Pin-like site-specific DNA recombinase
VSVTLGYVLAGMAGQDLERQLAALAAAGVDSRRVFTDKLSRSSGKLRPGLMAMLSYARSGDVVVVDGLDRLGRSAAEVARTVADLSERGITLRVLKEGLNTATATGRAVASIIATLAELDGDGSGDQRRAATR